MAKMRYHLIVQIKIVEIAINILADFPVTGLIRAKQIKNLIKCPNISFFFVILLQVFKIWRPILVP